MHAVRLIAEGVGPFEKLDLDLSDGEGNPHLGPHILAGVNGSGKSTILRTLAWLYDNQARGFDYGAWGHLVSGRSGARGLLVTGTQSRGPLAVFVRTSSVPGDPGSVQGWVRDSLEAVPQIPKQLTARVADPEAFSSNESGQRWVFGGDLRDLSLISLYRVAAYAPSRFLSYLPNPQLSYAPIDPWQNSLAFESTVKNETVQSWLLSLYGKEAIAKQRGETGESYRESFSRFERALAVALGEDIRLEVDIEPVLQLRLRFAGQSLNFSQLPDGIRSTAAWLADFMMRLNAVPWHSAFEGRKPGILLLDEADIHLHPKWQRTLLPAIRDALPDVQIIATSHSPFVISSCPDARVHVLKLDGEGRASALPPINAPIGESVTATLKDIFGVSSRFDIKTEQELREWNELTKKQVIGKIGAEEGRRLEKLIAILSERSEELRAIVGQPRRTPAIRVRSGASPGRRSPSAHSR